jgi:hypothetical protein
VVEITSSWTLAEYRIAVSRIKDVQRDGAQRKALRLIVVATGREQLPLPMAEDVKVIIRPNVITEDPDAFVEALAHELKALADEIGVARQAEPERLLEAKEYRAALISAVSLLETKVRERLHKDQWPQTRNPMSMRSLLKVAIDHQVLPPATQERLEAWVRVRDEVVHSSKDVSRAQATEIVNGVLQIIDGL